MQEKRTASRRAAALRQALMLSISSMLICVIMLVGMTYAWFTDSAVAAVNAIHTGNVNINLSCYSPTNPSNAQRVYTETKLFSETPKWTPGHAEVCYLKLSNGGNLPLSYSLGLNATLNVNSDLLSQFKYTFIKLSGPQESIDLSNPEHPVISASSEQSAQAIQYSPLSSAYQTPTKHGSLAVPLSDNSSQSTDYYALVLYYSSAGNNNENLTDTTITLGLRLLAVQTSADSLENAWNAADAQAPASSAVSDDSMPVATTNN